MKSSSTQPEHQHEESVTLTEAKTARKRICDNPFFVSAADIKISEPDLVFRLSPRQDSLRATPRFRSRVKKLLQDVPGVHYIKSERSFYFPAAQLNAFLKRLRETKYLFAVENSAGERLRDYASFRAQVLDSGQDGTRRELRGALLTPLIDISAPSDNQQGTTFCLQHYTTEQLRHCFPNVKLYSEKKKLAQSLSEEALADLLFNVQRTQTHVWLSSDVKNYLRDNKERYESRISVSPWGYPDGLLLLADLDFSWTIGPNDLGGLLIRKSLYKNLADAPDNTLKALKCEIHPQLPDYYFFAAYDSRLLDFFDKTQEFIKHHSELSCPASRSFARLINNLRQRQEHLLSQDHYRNLSDATLGLEDSALEQKLFPHQRVAVAWLRETPQALLGDDMGLGKTLCVLVTFDDLLRSKKSDFLLVACPNSLTHNWLREAQSWLPKRKLAQLPDTKNARVRFLRYLSEHHEQFLDGLVVNYECLRLDYVYPVLAEFCGQHRVLLCLDESQRAKNPTSKTFAALKQLAPLCQRRVLLSGTPTPKDISDIWAQMFVLDNGKRFGTNYYDWLANIAELGTKWSQFAIKKLRPEEVKECTARVHEVLLRRKKEDVVDLPEKLFTTRDIELTGSQKKRYDEVRKELLLRLRSTTGETFVREIDNILEEYLRAVQIASNPRLVDEEWKGEPAKFIELDEIVQEVVEENERKVVIWTNYRANVAELAERYKHLGTAAYTGEVSAQERSQIVARFQHQDNRDLNILIAIPAAGGVGITLTAAQVAVYVDKTWNAEHWLQSIDRIHRIGQTGTVSIISLHASGVDALIAKNLRKKERLLADVLGDNQKTRMELLPSREELIGALEDSISTDKPAP